MTEKELYQKAFSHVHASPETIRRIRDMENRSYKPYTAMRKTARRGAVIAAVIALVLLMGATAYAIHVMMLDDMKTEGGSLVDVYRDAETGEVFQDEIPEDAEVVYSREISDKYVGVSLVGVKDTPDYQAAQEFQTFWNEYAANNYNGELESGTDASDDEWNITNDRSFSAYNAFTTTLKEKILSLAEKYDLKLIDDAYGYHGLEHLTKIMGEDAILNTDNVASFREENPDWYEWHYGFLAYDNGAFFLQGSWWPEAVDKDQDPADSAIEIAMTRHVKGYFDQRAAIIDADEEVTEETYTTAQGVTVSLVLGPSGGGPIDDGPYVEAGIFGNSGGGMIFYDGPEAFVSVQASDLMEGTLTMEELKALADAVNFEGLGTVDHVTWREEAPALFPSEFD